MSDYKVLHIVKKNVLGKKTSMKLTEFTSLIEKDEKSHAPFANKRIDFVGFSKCPDSPTTEIIDIKRMGLN